jgi:hypothetical protein
VDHESLGEPQSEDRERIIAAMNVLRNGHVVVHDLRSINESPFGDSGSQTRS